MANTHGFTQVPRRKAHRPSGPPAVPNINLRDSYNRETKSYNFTPEQVEATITWCIGKASPVTAAPCHPDRHDAVRMEQDSNPFAALAESGRPVHSVLRDKFPHFVYTTLASKLGQHSLDWLEHQGRRGDSRRLIFSVPEIAQRLALQGTYFRQGEVVGEGEARGGVLIVDADKEGNLYIMTGYGQEAMPRDAGTAAGGLNCCYRPAEQMLIVDDGEKLSPQMIGATTVEEKGGVQIERKAGQATRYVKKD